MAICGHQFHGGDETDWILSTSVGSLDGSTTASRILHELFKKHSYNMASKTPRKKPKKTASNEDVPSPKPETTEESENFIVKKITGTWSFDNFDESQHLNGCPMKWLYHKKLLERNKLFKVARPCAKKSAKKDEIRREKTKNLRDKTPIEVKIHKINLIEKYTSNSDEIFSPFVSFPRVKPKEDSKELEMHRKKLAAKLNWKLHDETPEERSAETSSEISSRHNYLPPRPLLGLKPLLSVLLAPQQDTNCCSLIKLKRTSPIKTKMKASLTIQSLDLSFSLPRTKPRTSNSLRWGSKSSSHAKKLQIPNPITIKLEEKKKKKLVPNSANHLKVVYTSTPPKKLNDKSKQTKSLSSLFYELKGKTNYRNENERYFEEMIRDLTMDEGEFKIKRFLNISSANSDLVQKNPEKRKKVTKVSSMDSELNLVCEKVRFYEKKSSRGVKQGDGEGEDPKNCTRGHDDDESQMSSKREAVGLGNRKEGRCEEKQTKRRKENGNNTEDNVVNHNCMHESQEYNSAAAAAAAGTIRSEYEDTVKDIRQF